METAKLKIDDLIPDEKNPRKSLRPGDDEYEALRRSIEEFGYVSPVIVNKRTNLIVGGHQRIKVLKELGFEEIDVVYVDLDEANQMLLNISLNKLGGSFDMEKLSEVIKDIQEDGYDATLTGFSMDDIDGLIGSFDPLADDDSEDDVPKDSEEDEKDKLIVCPKCHYEALKEDFKI